MKKISVFCTVLMFAAANFCYAQDQKNESGKPVLERPVVETTDQAIPQNPSTDIEKPVVNEPAKPTVSERKNPGTVSPDPGKRTQEPRPKPDPNVEPRPKEEPAPRPKPMPKPTPKPKEEPAKKPASKTTR